MVFRYGIWLFALVMFLFSGWSVAKSYGNRAVTEPSVSPPTVTFSDRIAGVGTIEPCGEIISIGTSEPGLVTQVFVVKGQTVAANAPMFKIDTRSLEAELLTAEAAVGTAAADLQRVRAFRRAEEEPLLTAALEQARANVADLEASLSEAETLAEQAELEHKDFAARLKRQEGTVKAGASSVDEWDRAAFAVKIAEAKQRAAQVRVVSSKAKIAAARAQVAHADADFKLFKAGAWSADVKRAEAAHAEAISKVERLRLEIARRMICSPVAGQVLKLEVHVGEYLTQSAARKDDAPILLGDMSHWHVRVDLDEFDIGRFHSGTKAVMLPRTLQGGRVPLEFVAVEPYVTPKRSLTNSQRELVDTRVLQVIYRIAAPAENLYVGQQVDVFVEQ